MITGMVNGNYTDSILLESGLSFITVHSSQVPK